MCIIAYIKNNNKIVLFKNRDRIYNPKIQVVHEMRDNIEIAYIRDLNSNWIEGINEYGIGLINSALLVKRDEEEGGIRPNHKGSDGDKILTALCKQSLKNSVQSVLDYTGGSDISLKGHTIVCNGSTGVHIESTTRDMPKLQILRDNNLVLTNHGLFTNSGYRNRRKKLSSLLRKKIIEAELNQKNCYTDSDIFHIFNRTYKDLDPRFTPYRDRRYTKDVLQHETDKIFSTTSQILMNTTDRRLVINIDKNHAEYIGKVEYLPLGYKKKIDIVVSFTERDPTVSNLPKLV